MEGTTRSNAWLADSSLPDAGDDALEEDTDLDEDSELLSSESAVKRIRFSAGGDRDDL